MGSYSEKLKDPRWQKKRLEILQRDEFKCVYCCDEKTELQIHHLKYSGEPWQAPNENLITLCKHCHTIISSNKDMCVINVVKHLQEENGIILVKEKSEDRIIINLFYSEYKKISYLTGFYSDGKVLESIIKLANNG